ncbi:Ribosomal protein L7Ae/L30e/S12e/Gadd45 family, putative [Angomonas deanei]|uniref:Ribosomal protein L7Ae/L30e/S12e/Gadd45 family, putative n=1 Tax=Angomonas deanei TaxID=59799 RepID=A0A7G2C468_9TRYP|nr:Ribosomal protein L7Ae/L30e/S12e/Gadd45 family, putative [Angomonas deanei]
MKRVTFDEAEQAQLDFRHTQTVKRWKQNSSRKSSKIVYLSDYMEADSRDARVLVDTSEDNLRVRHKRVKKTTASGRPSNAKQVHFKKKSPGDGECRTTRGTPSRLKRNILQQRTDRLQLLAEGNKDYMGLLWLVEQLNQTRKQLGSAGKGRHNLRRRLDYLRYRIRKQEAILVESVPHASNDTTHRQEGTLRDPQTVPELAVLYPHGSSTVDQRSGRYPVTLSKEDLEHFHANCSFDRPNAIREYCQNPPVSTATSKTGKTRKGLAVGVYCRNVITDYVDDLTFTTLQKLYHEQGELKRKNKIGFRSKLRYVVGLQETIKHLKAGLVKLVILAADLEVVGRSSPKEPSDRKRFDRLEEAVETVYGLCNGKSNPIPVLCCMSRQRLAYALFAKNSHVSCVGVLQVDSSLLYYRALVLAAKSMSQL